MPAVPAACQNPVRHPARKHNIKGDDMALAFCRRCGKQKAAREDVCPSCGTRPRSGPSVITWLACILAGFIGLFVMVFAFVSAPPGEGHRTSDDLAERENRWVEQEDRVVLHSFPAKTAFDTIMEVTFAVENPNRFAIKDIEVECVFFGSSGTRIDSNKRTIYEFVPAGGRKTIPKFNMGFIDSQVASTSCEVTDFVRL